MVYLLKVTIVWALFLLLFEAFYKHNGRFMANRIYLLLSLAAGFVLPLIALPSNVPVAIAASQHFYIGTTVATPGTGNAMATAATAGGGHWLSWWLFIRIIYAAGVASLFIKCAVESAGICYLVFKNPYRVIYGRRVIITGKVHAPYSFMGRIFIGAPDTHEPQELSYILRHEAAHNDKRHWLDLLLMQCTCIMFWFHPLIWRYCYLLRLQHEYEADELAADNEVYAYGHFLLQQTLLGAVPSMAHALHFSPIKNRIYMLTRKNNLTPGTWKYLLLIPTLLGCTLLTAKKAGDEERVAVGNNLTYHGNTFTFRETDTIYFSPRAHQLIRVMKPPYDYHYANPDRPKIISQMNGEPVYRNEMLDNPATFDGSDTAYFNTLKKQFVALAGNIPDSLAEIELSDVVVDKKGRIAFYNLWFHNINITAEDGAHIAPNDKARLTPIIERLIASATPWQPAMVNGKAVNVCIGHGNRLSFHPMLPVANKEMMPGNMTFEMGGTNSLRWVWQLEPATAAPVK